MGYFLLKTEPSEYSYDRLERDGKAVWDGVTNNLALKNLRSARKGDLALIYHTGDEKRIVGIAEITSDPYPDPKERDEKLVVVDVRPRKRLEVPVPLERLKGLREFQGHELIRLPRLSVMHVDENRWKKVLQLAGE